MWLIATIIESIITQWGSLGESEGEFSEPGGVAVDSGGYVYVLDSGNNRIQKFESYTVANVNEAPFFTSMLVQTATQDVLYTYTVTADDPDLIHDDALTLTAPTLPGWLMLEDHRDALRHAGQRRRGRPHYRIACHR